MPGGAVAWWSLEGDASDALSSNDGVLSGAPVFASGEVGLAMTFDGTNDQVRVPAAPALDLGGASAGMTIEFWINPSTLSGNRPVVEWNGGPGTASPGMHVWHSFGTPGLLFVSMPGALGSADAFIQTGGGILTVGQWQHVAFTYDRVSGIGKLYRNGVEIASKAMGTVRAQTTYDVYLGVRPGGPLAGSRLAGGLDEVTFYARALSAGEVAAIHNASSAGKCAPEVLPVIVSQPQDQTVVAGQTAQFEVEASGAQTYQWVGQGIDLEGQTNRTLVLDHVQFTQAGDYWVVVSNGGGAVTSQVAQLTVNVPSCVPLPGGAVAWWPLEGDASDALGNNDGVLSGAPVFGNGEVGLGMTFDGTNDQVYVPATPALDLGGSAAGMTIEFWINPSSLSGNRPVVEWNGGPGTSNPGMHLWHSFAAPGRLFVSVPGAAGSADAFIQTGGGILTIGQWQHVTFTYDRVIGIGKLYRNGVEVASKAMGSVRAQTTYDLYLGVRAGGQFAGAHLAGGLDEVTFYTRALSAGEVAAIHNAGSAGKCPPESPAVTLEELIAQVENSELPRNRKKPLLASLREALKAFDRGHYRSELKKLSAFQHKLRAQIKKIDPVLAQALNEAAQILIDQAEVLSAAQGPMHVNVAIKHSSGRTELKFETEPGMTLEVEASQDMVHWEVVGTATEIEDGIYRFEQTTGEMSCRFYRAVVP